MQTLLVANEVHHVLGDPYRFPISSGVPRLRCNADPLSLTMTTLSGASRPSIYQFARVKRRANLLGEVISATNGHNIPSGGRTADDTQHKDIVADSAPRHLPREMATSKQRKSIDHSLMDRQELGRDTTPTRATFGGTNARQHLSFEPFRGTNTRPLNNSRPYGSTSQGPPLSSLRPPLARAAIHFRQSGSSSWRRLTWSF